MSQKYKWLVVGGCPRSGTTLLNLLLNSHDNIKITNEVSLVKLVDKIGDLYWRERKALTVSNRVKSKKENWQLNELITYIPSFKKSASSVLDIIYEKQFDEVNKNLIYVGDKNPKYYIEDMTKVIDMVGNLKTIHITRNPINVINSMMRRSYNAKQGKDYWKTDQTIDEGLNEWISAWNFITSKKDKNYLHLKYEDLIFKKEDNLGKISKFLGLDTFSFDKDIIISEEDEIKYLSSAEIVMIKDKLNNITDYWDNDINELEKKYIKFNFVQYSFRYIVVNNYRKWKKKFTKLVRVIYDKIKD